MASIIGMASINSSMSQLMSEITSNPKIYSEKAREISSSIDTNDQEKLDALIQVLEKRLEIFRNVNGLSSLGISLTINEQGKETVKKIEEMIERIQKQRVA